MLTEEQLLLQEIFAVPSNTLQSGRFEKTLLAAGCSHNCKSGTCMKSLDIDHDTDVTRH